jgi:hypothetical protein
MLWCHVFLVSLLRALKIIDPIVLYMGGYRYNSDNSIYHMYMISHATAYFVFDSIIEVAYGTADMLTNVHHVVVLFVSYFGMKAPHSGFEYLSNQYLLKPFSITLACRSFQPFLNL